MIINGRSLLLKQPVSPMHTRKEKSNGVSFGLSEAGYDIRVAEDIYFCGRWVDEVSVHRNRVSTNDVWSWGDFTLASSIEEFNMPTNLVGIVHDKSTWARKGLSVFNTVIEPGWKGFLTLELVYHGLEPLHIPAGSGIAQIIFHHTREEAGYDGKYQNQEQGPVEARFE